MQEKGKKEKWKREGIFWAVGEEKDGQIDGRTDGHTLL